MVIQKKYKKIVLLYLSFMLTLTVAMFLEHRTIYNHLVLINDREKVMETANNSIPVRVELYSKRWGKAVITESNPIRSVWSIIENMSKNKGMEEIKEDNDVDEISGTLYYLNGKGIYEFFWI